ncbi:MAG: hypothetical protein BWY09_01569 [Candidatus Hydrogenedentes bacterium ADurb.Bin179]|nr:MAG: hypothetical protein BWY09_01569 [Candidatus Hydrogenedentes bacterium ADurb.Bin179]
MGPFQRPFILAAPAVFPHDEQLVGGPVLHTRFFALQPVLEPLELQFTNIPLCLGSEIEVPAVLPSDAMCPRPDDDILVAANEPVFGLFPNVVHEVNDRLGKNIVPAADVKNGNAHLFVPVVNPPLFPIIVIGGMFDPVVQIGNRLLELIAEALQGKVEKGRLQLFRRQVHTTHRRAPAHEQGKLKRTAVVGQVRKHLTKGHHRHRAFQRGGGAGRRRPLGPADIGAAGRADAAVAPRLRADPPLGI